MEAPVVPAASGEPPGTVAMLQELDDAVIEEKEQNDAAWVKRFGRARASQFVSRLRGLVCTNE